MLNATNGKRWRHRNLQFVHLVCKMPIVTRRSVESSYFDRPNCPGSIGQMYLSGIGQADRNRSLGASGLNADLLLYSLNPCEDLFTFQKAFLDE